MSLIVGRFKRTYRPKFVERPMLTHLVGREDPVNLASVFYEPRPTQPFTNVFFLFVSWTLINPFGSAPTFWGTNYLDVVWFVFFAAVKRVLRVLFPFLRQAYFFSFFWGDNQVLFVSWTKCFCWVFFGRWVSFGAWGSISPSTVREGT